MDDEEGESGWIVIRCNSMYMPSRVYAARTYGGRII